MRAGVRGLENIFDWLESLEDLHNLHLHLNCFLFVGFLFLFPLRSATFLLSRCLCPRRISFFFLSPIYTFALWPFPTPRILRAPSLSNLHFRLMSSLGTVCINGTSIMSNSKPELTSDFEVESHDLALHPKLKTLHLIDGARTALTAVGLLAAITVLGVSADGLAVYEATHLPPEFNLPLWPKNFNIGPTIGLVVCSAIVILANGASLVLCRAKTVSLRRATHPKSTLPPLPHPF